VKKHLLPTVLMAAPAEKARLQERAEGCVNIYDEINSLALDLAAHRAGSAIPVRPRANFPALAVDTSVGECVIGGAEPINPGNRRSP
jgi:hypothetical protein